MGVVFLSFFNGDSAVAAVGQGGIPLLQGAIQQETGQWVLYLGTDGPAQGARAVDRVEAGGSQSVHGGVGDLQTDILLVQALRYLIQHTPGDLGDLSAVKLVENDDLIQAVEEFRTEYPLDFLQYGGF